MNMLATESFREKNLHFLAHEFLSGIPENDANLRIYEHNGSLFVNKNVRIRCCLKERAGEYRITEKVVCDCCRALSRIRQVR